jgi:hypothetical protein
VAGPILPGKRKEQIMNPSIRLKKPTLLVLITVVLACFGFFPEGQAVSPSPDGCYPNFTTAEGCDALTALTTGSGNTALGWRSENVAVGTDALVNNDSGANNNAIGAFALFSHQTGSFNNAVGNSVLHDDQSGALNNAFGDAALSSNISGFNNTAVGDLALSASTGDYNTALGAGAGLSLTTGSNNIYIGDTGLDGDTNVIAIGALAPSGTSYENTFIGGIYETVETDRFVLVGPDGHLGTLVSSRRYKDDIKPMDNVSAALFALKPVVFRYKQQIDPSHKLSFGLIAEDVAEVSADLVSRDKDGKPQTVRYEAVNAMLLNEFLKEHRTVQEQEATIAQLKSAVAKQDTTAALQQKQIEALAATVKEQSAQIRKVSAELELSKPAPQTVLNNQ